MNVRRLFPFVPTASPPIAARAPHFNNAHAAHGAHHDIPWRT